MTEAT